MPSTSAVNAVPSSTLFWSESTVAPAGSASPQMLTVVETGWAEAVSCPKTSAPAIVASVTPNTVTAASDLAVVRERLATVWRPWDRFTT